MTTVYVVVDEDRHLDPQVTVHATRGGAFQVARGLAGPDAAEETVEGCLLSLRYSVEGDHVWVAERDILA